MLKLLKSRVVLVTALFAAFGGALSKLLKIDEMEGYYVALTSLIALLTTLLISFLLKGVWSKKRKKTLQIILSITSVLFIISALYHTNVFLTKTISYHHPKDRPASYLVKGKNYSVEGVRRKALYPDYNDDEILYQALGGPTGKTHLWDQSDINANTFALITSYVLLVIFFSGSTFALLEILSSQYAKSTARNIE